MADNVAFNPKAGGLTKEALQKIAFEGIDALNRDGPFGLKIKVLGTGADWAQIEVWIADKRGIDQLRVTEPYFVQVGEALHMTGVRETFNIDVKV